MGNVILRKNSDVLVYLWKDSVNIYNLDVVRSGELILSSGAVSLFELLNSADPRKLRYSCKLSPRRNLYYLNCVSPFSKSNECDESNLISDDEIGELEKFLEIEIGYLN